MAIRVGEGVVTAGPDAAVAQISLSELDERRKIERNEGVGKNRFDDLWEQLRKKMRTVRL